MLPWWFEDPNTSTSGWAVGNTFYIPLDQSTADDSNSLETEENKGKRLLEYWPLSDERVVPFPRVLHNQRQGPRWIEHCRKRC